MARRAQGIGFMLPVAGVLGIQSDAAPAFYLNSDFTPGAIKAYVKSAPVGAALTFSLYVGTSSTPWITLTVAAGSTSVVATSDVDRRARTDPGQHERAPCDHVGWHHLSRDRSDSLCVLVIERER